MVIQIAVLTRSLLELAGERLVQTTVEAVVRSGVPLCLNLTLSHAATAAATARCPSPLSNGQADWPATSATTPAAFVCQPDCGIEPELN
ncbi:MAG: hypothetical protein ACYCOU_23185 [Sulfobacillus sp.]